MKERLKNLLRGKSLDTEEDVEYVANSLIENGVIVLDNPGWELYTKVWNDGRKEYRYGAEWVAMQLQMEGGFPTPEEAKADWLRMVKDP